MNTAALLWLLLAYFLGSVSFGIVVSKTLGTDVRKKDFAGASGMIRQYGWGVGLGVFVLDVAKGILALWLVSKNAADASWLAPLAVVAGHCWPVFFGFKGGQGLAPMLGAWGYGSPVLVVALFILGLVLIPLHKKLGLERIVKLKSTPFAAAVDFVLLLVVTAVQGPPSKLWGLLLVLLALLVRGLQILTHK